jgi:predicted DsbA family dithiol-disulfide isomerase
MHRLFRVSASLASAVLLLSACAQQPADPTPASSTPSLQPEPTKTMTIEIWSDVVCPFCYIGKREFEKALAQFPERDNVQVVWKSFELDPDAPAKSELDMYGMLVQKYGGTREDAKARVAGVVERAKTVGLDYNMDIAVVGSSFDAHRLLQFAKTKDKGDAMKERLLNAYFTEGAHLADVPTLIKLASEVGLDGGGVATMLSTTAFTDEVRADEHEAQQIGVRGVPFFVIDRKFSVSGAQQSEAFLGALQQAWEAR